MKTWMTHIPDAYLISEINLPGTHDSCTCRVQFPFFSKCQQTTIAQQLNSGIRFLDIRVEKDGKNLKIIQIDYKSHLLEPIFHNNGILL